MTIPGQDILGPKLVEITYTLKKPKDNRDRFEKEAKEKIEQVVEQIKKETNTKSPKVKWKQEGDIVKLVMSWDIKIDGKVPDTMVRRIINVLGEYGTSLRY